MTKHIRLYAGTIGCIYQAMDYSGYRGWLSNTATGDIFKIRTILNAAFPLTEGDSVTYSLNEDNEAINVTT